MLRKEMVHVFSVTSNYHDSLRACYVEGSIWKLSRQLFQLTLSDKSLSLRDKTAGQYGILMPKFTKIISTLLAVQ